MKFSCFACGQHIEIDDQASGMVVNCPTCNSQLTVPSGSSADQSRAGSSIGSSKPEKLQRMKMDGETLWLRGAKAQAAFELLFADLESDDPDIRTHAYRLLIDDVPDVLGKLIDVYRDSVHMDPKRSSIAGRVLGRKLAGEEQEPIFPDTSRLMYGLDVSFIACACAHCGVVNLGIPARPNGPMEAYFGQAESTGRYAVPVLCDRCSEWFYVVWEVRLPPGRDG